MRAGLKTYKYVRKGQGEKITYLVLQASSVVFRILQVLDGSHLLH